MRSLIGFFSSSLSIVLMANASRADGPNAREASAWTAGQLVPSPEVAAGTQGAHFGLRWQLTPALYSFGIHRSLNPWRWFIIEPIVRQSGSVEFFVSPEYLAIAPRVEDQLGVRVGVRSYFPVLHRGEYLSLSLASGYAHIGPERSAVYEAGAYVLYGFLGIQVAFLPAIERALCVVTLSVRVF